MYRKRLAALIMTGCLLPAVGCSTPSSGSGGLLGFGLFSGCCHSSSGGSSRSASAVTATPVVGYSGGADCPCSHQGGGAGLFHPAVLSQGMGGAPITSGPVMMGDAGMAAPVIAPQQFQGQPIPVTTQGVPPNMNAPMFPGGTYPGPSTLPAPVQGQPPRIQPVPQAPMGVMPSTAIAPASPWGPR
jgi:hypothetical protein